MDSFDQITGGTMMVTGGLLVIIYMIVICHICRGTKNPWLIWITCLLMASSIAVVIMGYTWLTEENATTLTVWLLGGSVGLHFVFFNVVHFLLAERYRNIS